MILTRDGKEIVAIYKQDGSEVDEVKDANGRLVYSSIMGITGTLPLSFTSRGKPLTDYTIYGNTVQNGTPSPDTPVDVVGCGVRTGNLLDESNFALIQVTSTVYRYGTSLGVLPQGTYVFNATKSAGAQSVYLTTNLNGVYSQTTISSVPFTFTADGISECIIRTADNTGTTWAAKGYSGIMLNVGTTALPYEPYGYKLPLTVNGTNYPIYLGEVQTTRTIKKLVLDGTENWAIVSGRLCVLRPANCKQYSAIVSTHFIQTQNAANPGEMYVGGSYINFNYDGVNDNIPAFKAYLAQQYQNGTPVTVWYVLANEKTGIVNEPLMKIGDYADTVSYAQSQMTIPTVAGANTLTVGTTVQPSAVSITGNIKPTGYGQLLDANDVDIQDKNNEPIFIHE